MNKVKSAIITTLFVLAALVLLFFATVSCNVPGSNGVDRYNSFLSCIKLGSDFSGEAYTVLYPEGVISAADYYAGIPDVAEGAAADSDEAKAKKEYEDKYVQKGGVFVEKDKLEGEGAENQFKADVANDASIISSRLGKKGYSSYSVKVENDYSSRVAVPTGFTYAAYNNLDASARSNALSVVSNTIASVAASGTLSLRTSDQSLSTDVSGITVDGTKYYKLTRVQEDITSIFKGFSKYSMGGNNAVKVRLTSEGKGRINTITSKIVGSTDTALSFFVGEIRLIALNLEEAIDGKSFYITVVNNPDNSSVAQDYAITLQSALKGENLTRNYLAEEAPEVIAGTATLGNFGALMLLLAVVIIFVCAAVLSLIRYKWLGLVNTFTILLFALIAICAVQLLAIEITIASALMIVLGLLLLVGCNFYIFESVKGELKSGKIVQAAIKSAYKKTVAAYLDLHIILLAVGLLLTLVGVGEVMACGAILLTSVLASYALIWFTRFMWYVVSTPVRDKFKFGGFKREVNDYED